MLNDLTISGVGKPVASPDAVPSYRTGPSATIEPVGGGSALPNPTLRLDAGLGIVVIEFRNAAGDVASSIPTQQQLDAYRFRFETTSAPSARPAPRQPPAEHAESYTVPAAKAPQPGKGKSGILA